MALYHLLALPEAPSVNGRRSPPANSFPTRTSQELRKQLPLPRALKPISSAEDSVSLPFATSGLPQLGDYKYAEGGNQPPISYNSQNFVLPSLRPYQTTEDSRLPSIFCSFRTLPSTLEHMPRSFNEEPVLFPAQGTLISSESLRSTGYSSSVSTSSLSSFQSPNISIGDPVERPTLLPYAHNYGNRTSDSVSIVSSSNNVASNTFNPLSSTPGIQATEKAMPAKKRRRAISPAEREKTKAVRSVGSCVRCRMMRLRCDCTNPCVRCLEILGKARTYLEPCYREDLGNITIVRQGNSEFGQDTMQFRQYNWKSSADHPRILNINWTLFDWNTRRLPAFTIECHEYMPRWDDVTEVKWQQDGRVTRMSLPTYACKDTEKLVKVVSDWLDAARQVIEVDLIGKVTDELERITISEVYRWAKKHDTDMIMCALRLRANTVLSAGCGSLQDDETLGIPKVKDAAAGYVGDRPLPPAIDHQIDVAIWEVIRKDQRLLITFIKRALFGTIRHKPWFETYLTFFTALSNVKDLHGQAVGWMNCQQQTESAVQVTYLVKKMIARWNYSAMNILYHFRAIFRGDLPLVAAEKDLPRFVEREQLDTEATAYVEEVLRILKSEVGDKFSPNIDEVTEMGDQWIRKLFGVQYSTRN